MNGDEKEEEFSCNCNVILPSIELATSSSIIIDDGTLREIHFSFPMRDAPK